MPGSTSSDLGDILGIWAHPDDEAWLSAGLMMRAVSDGHRVSCVTATKGEAGFAVDDPRPPEERMAVRAEELTASLAILGVTDHRWLGYRDGQCAEVADEEAVARLTAIIDEVRPDTVLTFAPDGATGHSDHVAACRWATRAVRAGRPGTRLLYAAKTQPWIDLFTQLLDLSTVMMDDELEPEVTSEADLAVWFACDETLLAAKVAAMRAQQSQIEPLFEMLGAEPFGRLVQDEFFREPTAADPF